MPKPRSTYYRPTSTRARAFRLMLRVRRALTTNMLTYGDGKFTILEASEDAAARILEDALNSERRKGREGR